MATPHRAVDSVARGLVDGVQEVLDGGANAVKSAGASIMNGLDKPFNMIFKGKQGPHRAIGRLADGAVNSAQHAVDQGVIGTVKTAGEGVMRALDYLPEQTGFPPDLGKGR
jgi:phage-related protein